MSRRNMVLLVLLIVALMLIKIMFSMAPLGVILIVSFMLYKYFKVALSK